ncbi:MAG: homoserine dehydrogenase [Bryobacteraceae bacterium]|nr:homoserine dehydrogenase [Bryobacteraceae bacterium]
MKLALIGFGNVGRAFAHLLEAKRLAYPFRIVAIHTARHGTAFSEKRLTPEPEFGPPSASIDEFLDRAKADVVVELTTLHPHTGEPAITHIRKAFSRQAHVVTANKGPIAVAYRQLCREAREAGVEFRFESTCMDGAPVFNLVRNTLPGVQIRGFAGVLNSTTQVVIAAMRRGASLEEGILEAQSSGIAEADASYDIDGWDSAAKTAALANVLMDAGITPVDVQRTGIADLTPQYIQTLAAKRRTVCLVARASATSFVVSPEELDEGDVFAALTGTSNLLLLHTDLMGTIGTISIAPGVQQTAYGVFSDIVDIARNL